MLKSLSVILLLFVVILAAGVGMSELGYRLYRHYAPLNEQVRRETFEQSRAYQEGTVRDLDNLRVEYAGGNDAQKAAIASVARHRFADVDEAVLTPELRDFRHQVETVQ